MNYVVLGMHKSGTTLVSQMLHQSGINMGDFDPLVSYDRGNQYERESALQLDMDIMRAKDDQVLCPCHGSAFDRQGIPTNGPICLLTSS